MLGARAPSGKGTTIKLVLPRTERALAFAVSSCLAPKIPEGLNLLLVENNDQVREFADHLLKEMNCRVVSVADAREALAALEKGDVDVLFSDVVMPEMSGVKLARVARQRYPDLPVLLATGYSEEVSDDAATEFEVIRKPYGADRLGAKLSAVVGEQSGCG
jgi:CheY-like chemotaxis protein